VKVRRSAILGDTETGPREESPEDWTNSLTPRVKAFYRRVWASMKFQMEACQVFGRLLEVSEGASRAIEQRNILEA